MTVPPVTPFSKKVLNTEYRCGRFDGDTFARLDHHKRLLTRERARGQKTAIQENNIIFELVSNQEAANDRVYFTILGRPRSH